MQPDRIADLLSPFLPNGLSSLQLTQASAHLDLLLKWNAKMNLTAVRNADDIVTRHFGESFFAARHLLTGDSAETIIDVGSGAGFPGIPFAIFSPASKVTLIESQNKKATFLKESIRAMGLKHAEVFSGRGEDFQCSASLVTLRAVEKFNHAATLASGLVAPGGRLALLIGVDQSSTLPEGFSWKVGEAVPDSAQRVLAVGTKK